MKKFLLLIGVAALATFNAGAQQPIYATQSLSTFLNQPQAQTNVAFVIDCRKQASVTVGLVNQMSTSATDNQSFQYVRSLDGIKYGTVVTTIALAPTASTESVQFTNLLTLGCGYIKLSNFTNAAATAVATNTVTYAVKINAP